MWNAKYSKIILPLGLVIAGCGGGGGGGVSTAPQDTPSVAAQPADNSTIENTNTTADSGTADSVASSGDATAPAVEASVKMGLCEGFYDSGFQLVEGKDATPPKSGFSQPAKAAPYADPAYGSCVTRVTDHEAEGISGFARNDYARRQPFNADDSRVLVYSYDSKWHLYDTQDMSYVRALPGMTNNSIEPQWHPTNPDLVYIMPNKGGMTISQYNVKTDEKKVVADFDNLERIAGRPGSTSIRDIWSNAARAWTKGEGSPSADARYWALQVETKDFKGLGMIVYDMQEDAVVGVYDFATDAAGGMVRPDHISMSPSGKYVVPSWNAGAAANCSSENDLGTVSNPCGLMAFTRDFKSAVGLTTRGPHSDIALDHNGRDVIVAGNYDTGWVEMWDLETGENTKLWQIYENGNGTAMHISGKNFNKPGWVLISTYMEKKPGWYVQKLMAVETKANPRILNIAHSYNTVETYFSETHAAVNRDFTKVLFNSNWQTANMMNIDAYMVTLPKDAVPSV